MAHRARTPSRPRVLLTPEVAAWVAALDRAQLARVVDAADVLRRVGSTLGRPLVDRVKGGRHHKMKELRPLGTPLRILFAFDAHGDAVLLAAGDKTGQWNRWYKRNIDRAEARLEAHQRNTGTAQEWHVTRAAGQTSAGPSR
jgi:hypothetical protein